MNREYILLFRQRLESSVYHFDVFEIRRNGERFLVGTAVINSVEKSFYLKMLSPVRESKSTIESMKKKALEEAKKLNDTIYKFVN